MIHRTASITAASIAGVILAGGAAVGANVGILNAADNSELGSLSADATISTPTRSPSRPSPRRLVDDPRMAPSLEPSPSTSPERSTSRPTGRGCGSSRFGPTPDGTGKRPPRAPQPSNSPSPRGTTRSNSSPTATSSERSPHESTGRSPPRRRHHLRGGRNHWVLYDDDHDEYEHDDDEHEHEDHDEYEHDGETTMTEPAPKIRLRPRSRP